MSDSPLRPRGSIPPRRQNVDSYLLYFDGKNVRCFGPLHQGAAVRDRIGVEGSERFGPFVLLEIYLPEGDTFLPPEWVGEGQTGYALSPEGICVSRIIDSSQAVCESVPLGAADSLRADAGHGRYWVVPPRLVGFSVFLPMDVALTFERFSAEVPRVRQHAFSVKWEDDQIFHSFSPNLATESSPAEST